MPAGLTDSMQYQRRSQRPGLVRFDNNKYSVAASAVGRPVEVQAYADRTVIRQDGPIVAEHPRSFGRGETTYYPWHYVPVLARKPRALRNGAPFKDWVLPAAIDRIRRRLASTEHCNLQRVDILNAVLTDGLPAVEAACAKALERRGQVDEGAFEVGIVSLPAVTQAASRHWIVDGTKISV
jgi:Mu transposase-like protein